MQETLQTIARKLREAGGAIDDLKRKYPHLPDVQALPDIGELVQVETQSVDAEQVAAAVLKQLDGVVAAKVRQQIVVGFESIRLKGHGHDKQLRLDAEGQPRVYDTTEG